MQIARAGGRISILAQTLRRRVLLIRAGRCSGISVVLTLVVSIVWTPYTASEIRSDALLSAADSLVRAPACRVPCPTSHHSGAAPLVLIPTMVGSRPRRGAMMVLLVLISYGACKQQHRIHTMCACACVPGVTAWLNSAITGGLSSPFCASQQIRRTAFVLPFFLMHYSA